MSIRIRQWYTTPGNTIPYPDLIDDRDMFPPELVRNILQWLNREREVHLKNRKPTDQVITAYEGTRFLDPITGKGTATDVTPGLASWEFESGTAEILLRHKATKVVTARHHYMTAKERASNLYIVGPLLWTTQDERIVLPTISLNEIDADPVPAPLTDDQVLVALQLQLRFSGEALSFNGDTETFTLSGLHAPDLKALAALILRTPQARPS